jgi:hypothetical protein
MACKDHIDQTAKIAIETPKISIAICAKLLHRVRPKHSIAFELRFGEELVSGALVRECFAPLKVFVDVARLIAVTRRFDVKDDAIRSSGTVDSRIAYAADGAVTAPLFRWVDLAARINVHLIEFDRNPKIHPNFSHRFTEISERTFGILACVADYDEMAAAQHHFIKPEIFEMAAIGEIYVRNFYRSLGPRLRR